MENTTQPWAQVLWATTRGLKNFLGRSGQAFSGGGHRARAYHFGVVNTNESSTIEDVSDQLESIFPSIYHLDLLPVPLHKKHDNPLRVDSYVRTFNLNSGQLSNIDLDRVKITEEAKVANENEVALNAPATVSLGWLLTTPTLMDIAEPSSSQPYSAHPRS